MKHIFFIMLVLVANVTFSQIVGGGGCVKTSANPNSILPTVTVAEHAVLAYDMTTFKLYAYKPNLPIGQRWVEQVDVTAGMTDTDTRLESPHLANDSLKFDIRNKVGDVIGSEGIPISALMGGVTVAYFDGASGTVLNTSLVFPTDLNRVKIYRDGSELRLGATRDYTITSSAVSFAVPLISENIKIVF
jgi:hypothetical protein